MHRSDLILILSLAMLSAASQTSPRSHRPFDRAEPQLHQQRSAKKFTPKGPLFPVDSYHGYIPVTHDKADIFYWMFPPKNGKQDAPLLFWFSGGPGCSSLFASLMENGPFNVTSEGKPFLNQYGWNDQAYLVFIDQPIGVGLSHASVDDMPQTEATVAEHMLTFFKKFLSEVFPEFKNRPLYLSGESFAGNYLPHIANKLYRSGVDYIKLSGIAIGNGWTNPAVQYPQYAVFAHDPANIGDTKMTEAEFSKFLPLLQTCEKMLKTSPASMLPKINEYCDDISYQIVDDADGKAKFNQYDIRGPCTVPGLCYDMSAQTAFINSPEVMNELESDKIWQVCDDAVGGRLALLDGNNDASVKLTDILNDGNIRVLIYSGDKDYICNWMGGQAWVDLLKWNRQAEFNQVQFADEGGYGSARTLGNLKFLRFFDAGHAVPMNNPPDSLTMINQLLNGWQAEVTKPE